MSNGKMNWALVDQCLSAILGYINIRPDIRIETLCDHFIPVLSPVETMIFIDVSLEWNVR